MVDKTTLDLNNLHLVLFQLFLALQPMTAKHTREVTSSDKNKDVWKKVGVDYNQSMTSNRKSTDCI